MVLIGLSVIFSISFLIIKTALLKPAFAMDLNGWTVQGEFMEWDYTIYDAQGATVATIKKELWNLTDTYSIEVEKEDALYVLMAVLAIDAEKCSRD